MKLYVARHGQTNYNELGLCNSDPTVDVHLTEVGTDQATSLAEQLKNISFDHIFVSELKRTKQTAEIVNRYHNAPMSVDSRLNDIRFGFEGRHYREYHEALDKAENKWTTRFNGGESIQDLRNRTQKFLDDLITDNFQSVLVITSGGVMQAIYGIIKGLEIEETWSYQPEKGSFLEFEV